MTQDVGSDPTVGLPLCLLCGSVVMCESRGSAAEDEPHQGENFTLKMQKL